MSWLRKALVHLALSRSDEALIRASGGAPRTVRGMTLDPRFQFLEYQARQRAAPLSVETLRQQTEAGAQLFGGGKVSGVRVEKSFVPGRSHSVPFAGRFRVDHGLAAREALIAGRGIAPAHRWLVDDLLASGELVELLPDYTLPSVPLSLLIVPERTGVARVRLLVDYLVEQIRSIPGIEKAKS